MIIGQTVLAVPIVTDYTLSAIKGADVRIIPTAFTLGREPVRNGWCNSPAKFASASWPP